MNLHTFYKDISLVLMSNFGHKGTGFKTHFQEIPCILGLNIGYNEKKGSIKTLRDV